MNSKLIFAHWRLALLALTAIGLLLGLEFAGEDQLTFSHALLEILELALMLTAASGIAVLHMRVQAQREAQDELTQNLQNARDEGSHWRNRAQLHVRGLGVEIQRQFDLWKLSNAEAEVCLLLLKGLSHKEIAALRGTSEATVRQQAQSAYEKSGMKGRAPLCAFFLEDLLPARNNCVQTGSSLNGSLSASEAHTL